MVSLNSQTALPPMARPCSTTHCGWGYSLSFGTDHPFTQEDLAGYNLYSGGDGKNYLLYRPYHLVAVEAPISIAKAALYGQPTGTPLPTPVADVITVAKRNLKAGEVLDGSGGVYREWTHRKGGNCTR